MRSVQDIWIDELIEEATKELQKENGKLKQKIEELEKKEGLISIEEAIIRLDGFIEGAKRWENRAKGETLGV